MPPQQLKEAIRWPTAYPCAHTPARRREGCWFGDSRGRVAWRQRVRWPYSVMFELRSSYGPAPIEVTAW